MEGLNKVMLLGNLGAEPDLKVFQGGSGSVLKLRLATSESYVDKDGNRQEKTEWHSLAIWGKRGEALNKFLKKGDRIFVEGSIHTSTYDKDGEKRYRTEINVSNVILMGGGGRKVSHGAESGPSDAAPPGPAEDFGSFDRTDDSDIPF